MPEFVHLHLHTQYSILDGANKIDELFNRVAETGQRAVAMTDHGNMHGVVEFYEAAIARNIKPIIGCEVYYTTGHRSDRTVRMTGGASTNHLTLLAKDLTGYRNLCKLVTLGYTEGFYFKPRIDWEILSELAEGIICLSGCLSGEFAASAREGKIEEAREVAERFARLFRERYFLEVQPHNIEAQRTLNAVAKEIGRELGIPLVATNDCHYLTPDDHYAQEVLMCVSTGKLITDPDRMRHEGASLHFKTAEEMLVELPDFEEAIRHSVEIAESCNVHFDFKTYHMPRFAPPAGEPIEEYFREQARAGLAERIAERARYGRPLPVDRQREYSERLEREIGLILEMGFAGYFLVVSDFIRWAKSHDIPVGPGRGSAAGSLVAYAMSITEIDPIENKLLFERFLNPERISLPDIDIDFCVYGRERVIDYVCERYGRDKVAQIVTFGTLKAKAAIKDVGRVLGLSYAETDRIAKLIPAPRQGFDYPLEEALRMEKRLREYAEGEGKELIELAMKLEGLSRHTSTHAAGIVIADRPIVELLPLMVDKDQQVVTQFSMTGVEKIGLVKFDFLGLKTLSVLHETVRMIQRSEGKEIDLNVLPLDDPRTYKLICSGRTIGVFQLESSGITDMVTRLKPSCFEDLVAVLALYRPGPLDAGMADHFINRKHGREEVRYAHPILEPILRDTYGIILYQEQIMQIAQEMAGYSLGQADLLRRAMGKKKPEEMAKHREIFTNGAKSRGVPETVATEVFNQMETFARYGFNRSHSVAYAMISFQTAYLKAHYPLYFMAALMTLEMGDTDRVLKNLSECREMGISVLPPDLNRGEVGFNVVDGKILFGLAAIKGVGEKVVERIVQCRVEGGPFQNFVDFAKRVDPSILNRRTMESLIKAGAFDWTGTSRAELMKNLDEVLKRIQQYRTRRNENQMGLFGTGEGGLDFFLSRAAAPEWPLNVKLSHEREALGFYLSGHPLERFRHELQRLGSSTIHSIRSAREGAQVTVAGVVTLLKLKNTKKGDRYATFVLEDLRDTVEVIVWPDTYQRVQSVLIAEDPVLVSGRLDVSDERQVLVASKIDSAVALRDATAREAVLTLSESLCSAEKFEALKKLLADYRGECPVKLILRKSGHSETVIALPPEMTIEPSEALCTRVEELFGEPVISFR